MVYRTLCQSLIGYRIPVWRGAAKTVHCLAVLKVLLERSYRFPTTRLYVGSKLLTVKQLFVLRVALKNHKELPRPKK